MIVVNCPYCNEEINILFGAEIVSLIVKGISDCECDHCGRVFEIYQGKEHYETIEKGT